MIAISVLSVNSMVIVEHTALSRGANPIWYSGYGDLWCLSLLWSVAIFSNENLNDRTNHNKNVHSTRGLYRQSVTLNVCE